MRLPTRSSCRFRFDWEIHPAYRWALQPHTMEAIFATLQLSADSDAIWRAGRKATGNKRWMRTSGPRAQARFLTSAALRMLPRYGIDRAHDEFEPSREIPAGHGRDLPLASTNLPAASGKAGARARALGRLPARASHGGRRGDAVFP